MLGIEGGGGNRPLKRSTQLFLARHMLGDWLMSSPNYTRIPLRGARYKSTGKKSTYSTFACFTESTKSKKNNTFSESVIVKSLKGHGNEADFLGFLQKLVPHRSLTLPFEPF